MEELGNFSFNVIQSASDAQSKRANLINCIDDNVKIDVGKSTPLAGQYAVASLNAAMKDLNDELIDAVVTCPINKANVQSDQFDFVGHTEYLRCPGKCTGLSCPLMYGIVLLCSINQKFRGMWTRKSCFSSVYNS